MNKFRVWDKETNTMYYPGEDGTQLIFGVTHVHGEEGYHIWQLWDEKGEITREGKAELMRCTGSKDVNGEEVFGSDIVTYEEGEHWFIAVIEWMEYEFCFRIIKPFEDIYDFDDWYENGTLDIRVVGNIHDNPELLEVLK